MKNLFVVLIFLFALNLNSQTENDYIQFSGNVYMTNDDSTYILPFTLIKNKTKKTGVYANEKGFFSIVVSKGDTLEFSCIGFEKTNYIVPNTLNTNKFFSTQFLKKSIHKINEVIIVPWNNVDELKRAFVNLKLKDDDIKRAYQNLNKEKYEQLSQVVTYDSKEFQKINLHSQSTENQYKSGLLRTSSIFDPFTWIEFIKSLKKK